jgi:hypothetical protein
MSFHRSLGDAQLTRDLLGCQASLRQLHDFGLAGRKQHGPSRAWTSSPRPGSLTASAATLPRHALKRQGRRSITGSDYTGIDRNEATSY